MLRLGAKIAALALEQIVGDEGDGQFALRLFADDLAAKSLLQAREDREAIERIHRVLVLGRDEHDKLAVDRRARGQRARQRLEIGIPVGNQLFAARPQAPVLAALKICARMPSYFHSMIQFEGGPSVTGMSATGRLHDWAR